MSRHAARPAPAIPDDSTPVPPAHRPTRWTVRTVRGLGMVFLGLAVALSLLSTLVAYRVTQEAAEQARASQERAAAVDRRLEALEQYVAGKGEQRDAETQRQNEQFNRFVCNVLDQLPPGEVLDRVRTQYGCGPGLMPTAAAGSRPETPPTANQPRATPGPAASGAADAAPTQPSPRPVAPPEAPAPSDAPPPVTPTPTRPPPAGVGGLLCTALPVIC